MCTGTGSLLVQPETGRLIAGLAVDTCSNILFAAGTLSGRGFAFDAESGDLLAEYQLATDFPSLIKMSYQTGKERGYPIKKLDTDKSASDD